MTFQCTGCPVGPCETEAAKKPNKCVVGMPIMPIWNEIHKPMIAKEKPPTCKNCGKRPCQFKSPISGYAKLCTQCLVKKAEARRRARMRGV